MWCETYVLRHVFVAQTTLLTVINLDKSVIEVEQLQLMGLNGVDIRSDIESRKYKDFDFLLT